MPPSYSKPSFLLFLKPIVIIQLFFLTFHLSFVHELHWNKSFEDAYIVNLIVKF